MTAAIVVVGSLNIDLVARAPRFPKPGETLLGSDFQTFFGGKGANQAVAARRCGAATVMVGRVGADAYGDAMLENLQREGVDLTYIRRDAETNSGVALIVVEQGGGNMIVVVPGANARLSADDALAAQPAFQAGGVLVIQLEIPLSTVQAAVHLARQRNMRTILNPAPAAPLPQELYHRIDYLILNQGELALLSGEAQLEPGLDKLQTWGARCIIVTMGEEGALVQEAQRLTRLAPHPVKAVDSVGAGDAFVGAFAAAILGGEETLQAAIWGNAAGALAVTRAGAQSSLPYRQEIEALLSGD